MSTRSKIVDVVGFVWKKFMQDMARIVPNSMRLIDKSHLRCSKVQMVPEGYKCVADAILYWKPMLFSECTQSRDHVYSN